MRRIAILSMLYGYSRQRRMLGFFSAVADLLVGVPEVIACVIFRLTGVER